MYAPDAHDLTLSRRLFTGFTQKAVFRRLPGATAAAALSLLSLPLTANALTISGTNVGTLPATTPVHADATTKSVIYYLDLHAGATDERFSVRLVPPRFATQGSADEGAAVDGPLQFGLYGPGTVGKVVTEPSFAPLCSSRDRAFHGYATGAATVDVSLPAGANTTLAIRYATGRRAPWVDTDLRLKFSFQQQLFGSYDASSPLFGAATSVAEAGTHTQTLPVPVMAKGKAGKIGAHLLLSTTPKGTYGEDAGAARSIKRSATVKVSGKLLPATSGKRVLLQWAKPGKPLRTAARVTTTSGGRFTASLTAPGKGEYELWASYPKQPGPLAADSTSCPVRFKVK